MSNLFIASAADYDDESDVLSVSVIKIDGSEKFHIDIDFTNRVSKISDFDIERSGDYEIDYQPHVLTCFAKAFKNAYAELSHDASPADVFDKSFTFVVPLEVA